MITNLYVMFEMLSPSADLSRLVAGIEIPGYSFSSNPQKQSMHVPGERDFPVISFFYAQNHFRIYVSRATVEFYRGAKIPIELAAGERELYRRILEPHEFSVRKWLATSEGWDDKDHQFVNIVSEGTSAASVPFDV